MNNTVIVMYQEGDRELCISLYDFLEEQYRHAVSTIVCNVTPEEYQKMLKQLKTGKLEERLLPRTKKGRMEYNMFRYLLAYDKENKKFFIANYNNPKETGNYVINNTGIHFDDEGIQFSKNPVIMNSLEKYVKAYTTETYEDVIKHYMNV